MVRLHIYYLPTFDRFFGDTARLTPELEAFMRTLYGVQFMGSARLQDGVTIFENNRGFTLRVITRNAKDEFAPFDVTEEGVLTHVREMLAPAA